MKNMTYLVIITICFVVAAVAWLTVLCVTHKHYTRQVTEQTERLDSLNTAVYDAECAQLALASDIEKLETRKSDLQHDVDSLTAENSELNAKLSALKDAYTATKNCAVETAKELATLKAEQDSLYKKNTSLKNLMEGVEMVFGDTTLMADPFLGINIEDMGVFRPKVIEELHENDVFFIGDLIVEGKTFLLSIPRLGNTTIKKIEDILERHGYTLESDVIHINRYWFRFRREKSHGDNSK